jgi:CheY-like chemotaxis protein
MARVLVVDDSAVDRRFVGGLLARDGRFQVDFAEDGSEALARMRESCPDVIVTDLQMPNRNGLELVAAVRMHHPDVPIILMTGHGSEDLAVEALHRGAANYVPKPQLGERLLDSLDEALSLSKADRTYDRLISCLKRCDFDFELESDPGLVDPLVELVQQMVAGMRLTDATGRFRVGAGLKEALNNSIYRGNLEISFKQMQDTRVSLLEGKGEDLVRARRAAAPYQERRVAVHITMDQNEARIVVSDQGPGFDPASIPAAGQPGSLDPDSGRGLVLMRSFFDEVTFNRQGNEVTLIKRRESAGEREASASR